MRCLPFCVPHEKEQLAAQVILFHGVLLTVSGGDTIAIYHCSMKIVSRGKGKSAVAAAAYRSGEKLTNEWDGMTHDYTHKGGVVHSEILLPPDAPPSFSDRSQLWNSVELCEKSNNAQLAREMEISLPVELTREEQIRLVREYCSSQFVSKGMCADFSIHDTGSGNPHSHILLTMRPLDERGQWAAKSKKEYVLDENGEKVKLSNGRYKTRKVDLVDWNSRDNAELWRKAWADLANSFLENAGHAERIDHRSFERQGIDDIPTVHVGVAASQMEKNGIVTERGELNRLIKRSNALMRDIKKRIAGLKEWLAELFTAKKELQAMPPQPKSPGIAELLFKYLDVQKEKGKKYSLYWQQQHTADELKAVAKAVNILEQKGIFNLDGLDAALSSVDQKTDEISDGLKAREKRMKQLKNLIENAQAYQRNKPFHDAYKQIKWKSKQEDYAEAHRAELTIWNAANRFLHANLPEGVKSLPIAKWEKELAALTAENKDEYEKLKESRAEVAELQKIRRYVDVALKAETQQQTQIKRHEHDL